MKREIGLYTNQVIMAFTPALIKLNGMIAGNKSSTTFPIGAPKKSGVNIKLQITITTVIVKAPQISEISAAIFVLVR